jgi:predicted ArsR family transcriptional regulator
MDKVTLLGAARSRVVQHLARGPRTAVQVAAELGIQVSAARKHLERLREMGIVDVQFKRGGPGRPKKYYALTEEGQELFPRRYDAILNSVLSGLVQGMGESSVAKILHGVASDLAASGSPVRGMDRHTLRRLVGGLNDLGFDPRLAEDDGSWTITSQNCPILRSARAHRELVCEGIHAEILRVGTGGSDVRRQKWIVDGDPVCTHVIERPHPRRRPASR